MSRKKHSETKKQQKATKTSTDFTDPVKPFIEEDTSDHTQDIEISNHSSKDISNEKNNKNTFSNGTSSTESNRARSNTTLAEGLGWKVKCETLAVSIPL